MRLFYYTWYENSEQDLEESLIGMGYEVVKCHIPMQNYNQDEVFTENLERIFIQQKCELFITFNFFPLIAKSAEHLKVKYIAWVYDAPHWTLYSPMVTCEGTYLFLFDRQQWEEIRNLGVKRAYHLPLPVNTRRLNRLLGDVSLQKKYQYEVSFIGSLYEHNMYRQIAHLPESLRGYIDGICDAQKKVYGYNFIEEVLKENIVKEIGQYVELKLDAGYHMTPKQIYANMLNVEVTSRERIELLRQMGRYYDVTVFSASDVNLVLNCNKGGIVSYREEMPRVFRDSKINLNMTLRSIKSGIPLRALDIMGTGGFLITNYQEEMAENFVHGKEAILFHSVEELLYYTDYFLHHEEEREEIAYCGWKKVCEEFSYETQLKKIFTILYE